MLKGANWRGQNSLVALAVDPELLCSLSIRNPRFLSIAVCNELVKSPNLTINLLQKIGKRKIV